MSLTPWETESVFLALYVATGLVEGADAESLLIVGPPGVGKSRLLMRFGDYSSILMVSDLTVSGLRDVAKSQRNVRHLILPEFQRVFAHPKPTVASVCGLLTNLMTGDAGRELVGPDAAQRSDLSDRQIGLLAAMTTDVFRENAKDMTATGFMSRFTVIGMDRDEQERKRVMHNIFRRKLDDLRPFETPLPRNPIRIEGAEDLAAEVESWVSDWHNAPTERLSGHIMSLLSATALLRGRGQRTRVERTDLLFLQQFTPYFQSLSFGFVGKIKPLPPLLTYAEFQNGKRHPAPKKFGGIS